MLEKKMVWHKVADDAALLPWQENGMCIVTAGSKQITLARHAGSLYAFAHKCPHASGIMANGFINAAGQVACPLHRYRFDMKNGRNTSGEGYFLKTYSVKVDETGISVGWEDKGLLGIW
jgi:3-phenylpropionate/trans-cinnamate dioxygenase ferredoxin subunit